MTDSKFTAVAHTLGETAKEPNWIGHASAQRRIRIDGSVEYRDPANQSLAIMLGVPAFHGRDSLFAGANLWEVDGFVERMETIADPEAGKYRAALNKIRHKFEAIKPTEPQNIHGNELWDDLRAHADAINLRMGIRDKVPSASTLAMLQSVTTDVQPANNDVVDALNDTSNTNAAVAPSLGTAQIARLFAGLKSWNEDNWNKRLGEPPAWMIPALVQRGSRGRGAHQWNPLELAKCLIRKATDQDQTRRQLHRLFHDKPALEPWSEEWKAYESDWNWYGKEKPEI